RIRPLRHPHNLAKHSPQMPPHESLCMAFLVKPDNLPIGFRGHWQPETILVQFLEFLPAHVLCASGDKPERKISFPQSATSLCLPSRFASTRTVSFARQLSPPRRKKQ